MAQVQSEAFETEAVLDPKPDAGEASILPDTEPSQPPIDESYGDEFDNYDEEHGREIDGLTNPPAVKAKKRPDRHPYRHFQPLHPTCSRILELKWDRDLRKLHKDKLKKVQHTVDNAEPKLYLHLHLKLKKLQKEQDRMAEIERNNLILVDRMSHVWSDQSRKKLLERPNYSHSLNSYSRKQREKKIKAQNSVMAKRLEKKEPHLDHLRWDADRRRHLGYLDSISSYPNSYEFEKRRIDKAFGGAPEFPYHYRKRKHEQKCYREQQRVWRETLARQREEAKAREQDRILKELEDLEYHRKIEQIRQTVRKPRKTIPRVPRDPKECAPAPPRESNPRAPGEIRKPRGSTKTAAGESAATGEAATPKPDSSKAAFSKDLPPLPAIPSRPSTQGGVKRESSPLAAAGLDDPPADPPADPPGEAVAEEPVAPA
ncbi:KIAA1430-like protein-domain-containing protein [Polychytrium aggregatum]|uniref:KIAA1430-like protein-domain-containing protein n=1 Tax=Polychytrium aggregatum TaxID=110093 RepID=UPI0022FDDF6B|nr:KIAA1430-like protein-domain-containing protein [Polychytrium aggregatum]KAI9207107.1 KIAA1430-like protein-domain-containing protein [Polychytrium aggregatum]